jgi:ribosomal protein S14
MLESLRRDGEYSEDSEDNYNSDNGSISSEKDKNGNYMESYSNCDCMRNIVRKEDIELAKQKLRDLAMDTLGFRFEELSDSEQD